MSSPSDFCINFWILFQSFYEALVKNDINPNLVHSKYCINCSFLRLRNSITFVMNSLNVVNIAVLFGLPLIIFWQLFFLSRDIFSRIALVLGFDLLSFSSFADACCVVCVDAGACCFYRISSLRKGVTCFGLTSGRIHTIFTSISTRRRRSINTLLIIICFNLL